MERLMWRVAMVALIGVGLAAGGAVAAEEPAPAPQCEKAEINPVTGHVLCIKPLGAPVEPPPAEAKAPCKDEDVRGQWSYGPNCTPDPAE
jgi:hypothetical protein